MQIASGKDAAFNASYSSGVGSYTSSGTNFNSASPTSHLKMISPPGAKMNGGGVGATGRPSYTNFQSPNVDIKNSIYSAYDIPNTEKLGSPLVHNELLAHEVLAKAGPATTYQRRDHSHDIGSLAGGGNGNGGGNNNASSQPHTPSTPNPGLTDLDGSATSSYQDYSSNLQDYNYKSSSYSGSHSNVAADSNTNLTTNTNTPNSSSSNGAAHIIRINPPPIAGQTGGSYASSSNEINQDPDPIRIVRPNNQSVVYKQQVSIRYLQPPTPPPPAPIIIREKQMPPPPSQPPIIIRQTAPPPPTPPPLTIREKAPTPPPYAEPTIIERPIPPPSAPPRQVIIERVPAPPSKPRPIIYEKWLPYKAIERPVIVQKIKHVNQKPTTPKNVIIEYEKPKAVAIRQVIEEGVFRVDPTTYQTSTPNGGEVRIVDRITDLPLENSRILSQYDSHSSAEKMIPRSVHNNIYSNILATSSILNSSTGDQNSAAANMIQQHQQRQQQQQQQQHQQHQQEAALEFKKLSNLGGGSAMNSRRASEHFEFFDTSNVFSPASLINGTNVGFYSSATDAYEYETITTSVPESLAQKIIAEARAAGITHRAGSQLT